MSVKELMSSTSPVPSNYHGMTQEAIQRTFFTSSSKRAQLNHDEVKHFRRAVTDGPKFKDVRGRQANLKANDWRFSTKYRPNADTDTTHRRVYMTLPLDNAALDREVAAVFLKRGRAGGEASGGHKMETETSHSATFPPRKGPQPPRAESYKPQLDGINDNPMLETLSASRRQFPWHDSGHAQRFRGELVNPLTNGSPLPDSACKAGRAASAMRLSHSATELRGAQPTAWRAGRVQPKAAPAGECWQCHAW